MGRKEKPCFGRKVLKIPGKFRFSFTLLARDTLTGRKTRTCLDNTELYWGERGLCMFYTEIFCLLSYRMSWFRPEVLQSQIVNRLKKQS